MTRPARTFPMDIDIGALRADFSGDLLRPGDAAYDDSRRVWNAMVDKRPALIARCTSSADVAAAIRFGRTLGLELGVRGGCAPPIRTSRTGPSRLLARA